jgi:hypothetical protein
MDCYVVDILYQKLFEGPELVIITLNQQIAPQIMNER